LIGLGVGAAGTSLLALLAKRVSPGRRPAAATIVWIMMIAGFALTSGIAGSFLDPFTPERLIAVTAVVAALAVLVAIVALYRLESSAPPAPLQPTRAKRPPFRSAFMQVWGEAEARRFTIFVFVSMLAYSAQDLILEPFAGTVFGMTPGESTSLSGVQHSGVMIGMILIALGGSLLKSLKFGILRAGTIGGCVASALALLAISLGGFHPASWPLHASVFALGVANGAFAVAAIGTMMALAGRGRSNREGLRMGLWGAAQAIAFALGGFIGTAAIDLARVFFADPAVSYALVFSAEAMLFIVAARLGSAVSRARVEQVDERLEAIPRVEFAGMAQERL
jgi:MFS transporter, BCD family, chlorophyll transporter